MNAREKMKQMNKESQNQMNLDNININTPLGEEDEHWQEFKEDPVSEPEEKPMQEEPKKTAPKKKAEKAPVVRKTKKPGPKAKYEANDDEPKKAINILLTPEIMRMARIAKSAYDDNLTLYIQELIVNDFAENGEKYKKISAEIAKKKMEESMADLSALDL